MEDHFHLSRPFGGKADAVGLDDAPNAGHKHFPGEDQDDHPGVEAGGHGEEGLGILNPLRHDESRAGQIDERPQNKEFITEGVHDPPEHGGGIPLTGEIAVQGIGDGRDDEQGDGDIGPNRVGIGIPIGIEGGEKGDGQDEPTQGDRVGQFSPQISHHRSIMVFTEEDVYPG